MMLRIYKCCNYKYLRMRWFSYGVSNDYFKNAGSLFCIILFIQGTCTKPMNPIEPRAPDGSLGQFLQVYSWTQYLIEYIHFHRAASARRCASKPTTPSASCSCSPKMSSVAAKTCSTSLCRKHWVLALIRREMIRCRRPNSIRYNNDSFDFSLCSLKYLCYMLLIGYQYPIM